MGRRGEALVVALVMARVIYSVPRGLLLGETLGLLSVGVFGILLEFSIEDHTNELQMFRSLKPRPGSSSGIFLGTVTLPTVMMSRLIQHCRSGSKECEGSTQYFENLKMQFWIVSACSFGVLLSLLLNFIYNNEEVNVLSRKVKLFIISLSLGAVFSTECFLSVSQTTHMIKLSELMATMIVLLLVHGLLSSTIVKYLLKKFPSCFSIGEAVLVAGGLVLYFSDVIAYVLSKVNLFGSSRNIFEELNVKGDKTGAIIQAFLGSLLLATKVYKAFLYTWNFVNGFRFQGLSSPKACSARLQSILAFYAALGMAVTMIAPVWLFFIKDFQTHPLLWIINFMFTGTMKRSSLCIYWIVVICLAVQRFYNISKSSMIERILLRKYYHLLAVIMFVPALLLDPDFLKLAFGMALAAFVVLEMIRIWNIPPLGNMVDQFMNAFTDHRDSNLLIISHFSLLLGCAIPIWMSDHLIDRPLAQFAGILSLGIGDTMASLVGHKYGVLRWSKGEKKTLEGTAAGIMAVLLACLFLLPSLSWTGLASSQGWLSLLIAVVFAGLLEAHTTQLDNAFIPLIFYSLLCC